MKIQGEVRCFRGPLNEFDQCAEIFFFLDETECRQFSSFSSPPWPVKASHGALTTFRRRPPHALLMNISSVFIVYLIVRFTQCASFIFTPIKCHLFRERRKRREWGRRRVAMIQMKLSGTRKAFFNLFSTHHAHVPCSESFHSPHWFTLEWWREEKNGGEAKEGAEMTKKIFTLASQSARQFLP